MTTNMSGPLVSARAAIWLPIAAFAAALLGIVPAVLNQNPISLIMSGLFVLIGIMYLVVRPLELHADAVRIKNALGMVVRTYPITGLQDLRYDDGALLHVPTGKRIPTRSLRGEDRDRLFDVIEGPSIEEHPADGEAYR